MTIMNQPINEQYNEQKITIGHNSISLDDESCLFTAWLIMFDNRSADTDQQQATIC